jgi:hypothetical protein
LKVLEWKILDLLSMETMEKALNQWAGKYQDGHLARARMHHFQSLEHQYNTINIILAAREARLESKLSLEIRVMSCLVERAIIIEPS